jgi:hypothetical protein
MNSNFVIMGLPASGKTTFLAALWHLIEANETECRLKLDGYQGDLSYLNHIAEAWRSFKPVPRTSLMGDRNVTVHLHNSETGDRGTAFFPDLAGETFDRQIEQRQCRSDFIEKTETEEGILFFINADVREDTLSITEFNSRIPPAVEPEPENDSTAHIVQREWGPQSLPAQVKVVQLLSDLLRPPFTPRVRNIAILVSAWDLTGSMSLAPREWLATQMPLVDQFLRANVNYFKHQVYGVSAQGVNLEDDKAVDEATKLAPSKRIKIVGANGEGHDLTEPLVWLLSADK